MAHRLLPAVGCLFFGSCIAGCVVPGDPATQVSFNPFTRSFTFKDTKDNVVELKGLAINGPNGEVAEVESLTINNNASAVTDAQVAKLDMINQQIAIHGQNISNALAQFQGIVAGLTPQGIFGGGVPGFAKASLASPQSLEQLAKILAPLIQARLAKPVQPKPIPQEKPVE